jgi:mRNA (guanine-N7-)-methyltransferase
MADAVESSYDLGAQRRTTVKQRQRSEIIHLRHFNNWVKSVLIDRFCPQPHPHVFDCACGKGGDIPKWKLKSVNSYVFADRSSKSLTAAYEKFLTLDTPCRSRFLFGDIFGTDISPFISDLSFHLVSCQFALHYAFRTEENARQAVRNLCSRLLPGGHVILTIPNAARIVKQFRQVPDQHTISISISESSAMPICTIQRHFDLDRIPPFGAEYLFWLKGSVEAVTDGGVAEYLVHPGVLVALFKACDCTLIETREFHEAYVYALRNAPPGKSLYMALLQRLDVENARMSQGEWDVISYYSYFVFKKGGSPDPMPEEPLAGEPRGLKFRSISVATGEIKEVSIDPKRKDRGRRND